MEIFTKETPKTNNLKTLKPITIKQKTPIVLARSSYTSEASDDSNIVRLNFNDEQIEPISKNI